MSINAGVLSTSSRPAGRRGSAFPALPSSTAKQTPQTQTLLPRAAATLAQALRCCHGAGGTHRAKGDGSWHMVGCKCNTGEEPPARTSASREKQWPLCRRCRALGAEPALFSAGAAALPWFENSSEIRAEPRGTRPWDPDLPQITRSPPHAAARHRQPLPTRSARLQGAEEMNPAAPLGPEPGSGVGR